MSVCRENGVELYYEIHGEGEPLVLVAGLMSDSQSWVSVMEELAESFQVIVFDNRGVGRSTQEKVEITVELMALDLLGLLDRLGIAQANILGHSLGGFVAQYFAVNYPDRVKKLILEATATKNTDTNNRLFAEWGRILQERGADREWFYDVFKMIFSSRTLDDENLLELMLAYSVNYPYPQLTSAFLGQLEAIKEFDFTQRAAEIRMQGLLLCGEDDRLFSPAYSVQSFSGIKNLSAIIIPEAGHAVHVDSSAEFILQVKKFIQT